MSQQVSPQQQRELQQIVDSANRHAQVQSAVHKLAELCWDKCVGKPGDKLSEYGSGWPWGGGAWGVDGAGGEPMHRGREEKRGCGAGRRVGTRRSIFCAGCGCSTGRTPNQPHLLPASVDRPPRRPRDGRTGQLFLTLPPGNSEQKCVSNCSLVYLETARFIQSHMLKKQTQG